MNYFYNGNTCAGGEIRPYEKGYKDGQKIEGFLYKER